MKTIINIVDNDFENKIGYISPYNFNFLKDPEFVKELLEKENNTKNSMDDLEKIILEDSQQLCQHSFVKRNINNNFSNNDQTEDKNESQTNERHLTLVDSAIIKENGGRNYLRRISKKRCYNYYEPVEKEDFVNIENSVNEQLNDLNINETKHIGRTNITKLTNKPLNYDRKE